MLLLILSDSHGHPEAITEAIRRTRPDVILFAGDGLRDLARCDLPCPCRVVRGNCDVLLTPLVLNGVAVEPTDDESVVWDGIRILLMHGHRYGVKSTLDAAIAEAIRREADVLVFGHTHQPLEQHLLPDDADASAPRLYGGQRLTKPLTVFNPGSAGAYPGTFGTMTVRSGQLLFGHGTL